MPPFGIFLGSILLANACLLVSGRSRIPYPLVPNESLIAPSKYAKHPSHPLASDESLIGPLKYATHCSHVVAHGRRLEAFHPPTTFKTFGDGIDPPLLGSGPIILEEIAVAIAQSQTGINSTNIRFRSGFSEGPDTFAYVRQLHEGVPFANAVANVALHNNRIVSFGSSFVETTNIVASTPSLDVQSVTLNAENVLSGIFNGHAPTLEYLVQSDGSIALTHVVQIQNDSTGTWFEAFIDAHSGEVLSVTDFVAEASYKVVPIWEENFSSGQVTLIDPQDTLSSPLGWHNNGNGDEKWTAGNNIFAYTTEGNLGEPTHANGVGLVFDYTFIGTRDPARREFSDNPDASCTNAFYIMNTMHDIAYKYGFTEKSFNFQANNFGKGGLDDDLIVMNVQDRSRMGAAFFATLPDGQRGSCNIGLWARTAVRRDGAMDNGILIHEFTHGITNRMTGGGTARCLQTAEARGLGEGWSDAMAEWAQQKPILPGLPLPDYVLAQHVTNKAAGIRTHPYSISNITNPLRYSSVNVDKKRHDIGEVWANMLHNVYDALVKEHGFSENAKTDASTPEGNVVFLHLFIDALSIQPCNPTFVNARDAWIQADRIRYAGTNRCLLWRAFASRGLGVNAANFIDDPSVPSDC